jgi:hypothetical protein
MRNVAFIAAALLPGQVLPAQSQGLPPSPSPAGAAPVQTASNRVDHRLAYIHTLLNAAPAELAQSSNVLRAFGFATTDTSAALRGLSIALVDTTGARVSLLMGDGATIDALPLHARRGLATASVFRGRGSPNAQPDSSTAALRVQTWPDSQTLVFVKPIPHAGAPCDCLLDVEGAIVAALSPSGSRSFLTEDGMLAGTAAAKITLPSLPPPEVPADANRLRTLLDDQRSGIAPPFAVLAFIVAGVGALLLWRRSGWATGSVVRRDQLVQTTFDANDLISELASEASARMGDSTRLETHFDIAPAVVRGDRKYLASALRRIIRAANRAMPRGGTLTLVTRFAEINDESSRDRPTVGVGHYVVVAVEDTGRPMPEDRRQRLLALTHQEPREQVGSVGDLTLVTSIVHAHGWWLHCTDRRGGGNVIEIYIPLAPETIMPLVEWQEQLA